MITKLADGLRGVDHVAYVTRKPKETLHFYRDILGFPLLHCIVAPGWGNDPHPDFFHFFFDIGNGAKLAFFYYLGEVEGDLNAGRDVLPKARHLAMLVDTEAELDAYQRRIEDAGYPLRHRVMHEVIESIYVWDPNGYNIEISRPLRAMDATDAVDAAISMQALIDVLDESAAPTIAQVWQRKGELILAGESA
ncbi:MAG TPA: VOC family protein [Ilumatobacteraceae bacterium]|jgi:catechol 2,3-dioxygenase-like lactoylglutathione lyase family enzyme